MEQMLANKLSNYKKRLSKETVLLTCVTCIMLLAVIMASTYVFTLEKKSTEARVSANAVPTKFLPPPTPTAAPASLVTPPPPKTNLVEASMAISNLNEDKTSTNKKVVVNASEEFGSLTVGLESSFSYDPDKLQIIDIQPGSHWNKFVDFGGAIIDNENGKAYYSLAMNPDDTINNSTELITLSIQKLATDSAILRIDPESFVVLQEEIQATPLRINDITITD